MIKKWQKKLDKLDKDLSKKLYLIIFDIINLDLDQYKVDKLEGFEKLYRIRKGKIRIIFSKDEQKGIIEKIDFRGNVYKDL